MVLQSSGNLLMSQINTEYYTNDNPINQMNWQNLMTSNSSYLTTAIPPSQLYNTWTSGTNTITGNNSNVNGTYIVSASSFIGSSYPWNAFNSIPFYGGTTSLNGNAPVSWNNSVDGVYDTTYPYFYNTTTYLTSNITSATTLTAIASGWYIIDTILTVDTLDSGTFYIGMLLSSSDIPIPENTFIKAYASDGTYILNQSATNDGTGTLTGTYSSSSNNIVYGEWLQLQVPTAVNLVSFTLYSNSIWNDTTYYLQSPSNFIIVGSTDGTNWSLIHIGLYELWDKIPMTRRTNVNASSTFTYFRIIVMSLQGYDGIDQFLGIGYLQLNSNTNALTVSDSFTQYECTSIDSVHNDVIYTSNLPIQTCSQFVFTCQMLINNATDDFLNFNFGCTNPNTGDNGVTFNFQISSSVPGINLFLNGTFIEGADSNYVSNSMNSSWFNGTWSNIIIVYNRGTIGTWQLYINGMQIYNLSDPNNLGWVNNYSGNYFSITSLTGVSNMNSYIRQINFRTSMPFEIVTPYTWYSSMSFASLRSDSGTAYPWPDGISGVDPNIQVQLSDTNSNQDIAQNNILYNQFPVQNYSSFTLTFQFNYSFSGGNWMYIFFGGKNVQQTEDFSNQYSILINPYTGYSNNGFSGSGVYLLNTSATAIAFYSTSFTENTWNTFSVNYNRSNVSTWGINYNGTNCINYSDDFNQQWLDSSIIGNYWGLGASSNVLTSYFRQVSMVVTPYTGSNSQKLLTPLNYYNNMTVASQGPNDFTAIQSSSDPLVQYQVCSSTLFSNGNNLYINNAIQNNSSFVFQFEYFYNGQADNGASVFFGSTTGSNYFFGASSGGITLDFQIWENPSFYIFGPTGTTLYNTTFTSYPIQNTWIPVTITYTKGTVNTWVINHNGQYISYSDSNNNTWLNTQAGTYSGIGAHGGSTGATTINSYIRKIQLSTVSTNSSISQISSSLLNSLAPVVGMYIDIGNTSSYSGSGTTISDLSGNGYTYTMVNSPVYTSAGTASYLTFDGSSQYLNATNSGYSYGGGSLTFECWVSPSGNGVIIDESSQTGLPTGTWHQSMIELSSGNIFVRIWNGASLNLGAYTNGNWYQIVLTYDGITQRGYLNGLLVSSNTVSRSIANTISSALYYQFGTSETTNNLGNGGYFNGKLNTIVFYNTAISDQQVTLNYNRICSRFSLTPISVSSNPNINYFPMANTVTVSSSYNNTGSSAWMSFCGSVNYGNVAWTSGGGTTVGGTGTSLSYSTSSPFAYNQAGGFSTTVSSTSYNGEWIQIQCNSTLVNSFTIYPQPTSTFYTRSPSTFVLAGSNNGSTWTALHIVKNNITWSNSNGITFTCNQNNTTMYTYFRLIITAVSGNTGNTGFGCLLLNTNIGSSGTSVTIPPTIMSASTLIVSGHPNNLLNGTFTASASSNSSSADAFFAFQGFQTGTATWVTSTSSYPSGVYTGSFMTTVSGTNYNGEWIQLAAPYQIIINSFSLQPQQTSTYFNRAPTTFVFAGSNDKISWTPLHIQSTSVIWSNSNTQTFNCNQNNNTDTFIYFRLIIMSTTNSTDGYTSIGYLQLNSYLGGGPLWISKFYKGKSTQTGNNGTNLLAADIGTTTTGLGSALTADPSSRFIEILNSTNNFTGKRHIISCSYNNITNVNVNATMYFGFNNFGKIYQNNILLYTDGFYSNDLNNLNCTVILSPGINTFDFVVWKNNTTAGGCIFSLISNGIVLMRSDNYTNTPLINTTKTTITSTQNYLGVLDQISQDYSVGAAYGLTKLRNNYTGAVVNVTKYTVPIHVVIKTSVQLYYSTNNGVSYTGPVTANLPASIISITYGTTVQGGNTIWLVCGRSSGPTTSTSCYLSYSLNGTSWTTISGITTLLGTTNNYVINGVYYGVINELPMWICVGGRTNASSSPNIAYTKSQIPTTGWTVSNTSTSIVYSCAFGKINAGRVSGNGFVCCGANGSGACILYSTTGTSWTQVNVFNQGNGGRAVTIASGYVLGSAGWVVGGTDNAGGTHTCLYYSTNGASWTICNIYTDTTRITTSIMDNVLSVASGIVNGIPGWIACASTSTKMAYSTDGINWIQNNSIFTTAAVNISWTGTYWIAYGVGTHTSATSIDGINWSNFNVTSALINSNGVVSASGYGNIGTTSTTDFYADPQGNLMTSGLYGQTLQNWSGGAPIFVNTWYDQSTSSNNLTQSTTSAKPTITWNTTQNAWCVDSQNTSSQFLSSTTTPLPTGTANLPYSFVVKTGTLNHLTGSFVFFAGNASSNSSNGLYMITSSSFSNYWFGNDFTVTYNYSSGQTILFNYDSSNHYSYVNGKYTGSLTRSGGTTTSGQTFYLFRDSGTTNWLNGQIYYAIFLKSALNQSNVYPGSGSAISADSFRNFIIDGPILNSTPSVTNTAVSALSNVYTTLQPALNNGLISQSAVFDNVSTVTKNSCRAAYALVLLTTSYSGPVVQIRRAIDNTLSDFYADIQGNLGTSTNGTGTCLNTWLKGSPGYIVTWYNQLYPTSSINSNTFTVNNQTYTVSTSNSNVGTTSYAPFDNNKYSHWEIGSGSTYYTYPGGIATGITSTTISGSSYNGEWLQINVPTAVQIDSFTLCGRQDSSLYLYRTPNTFKIAGSNDNSTWTLIHTATNVYFNASSQTFSVNAGNTNSYIYFRIVVNAIGNGSVSGDPSSAGYLDISEWTLYTTTSQAIPPINNATQTIPAFQPVINSVMYYQNTDTIYVVDSQNSSLQYLNIPSNTVPTGVTNANYSMILRHGLVNNTTDGAFISSGSGSGGGSGNNNQSNVLRCYSALPNGYVNYWYFNDFTFGTSTFNSGNQICCNYDGTNRKAYINTNLKSTSSSSGNNVSAEQQYLFRSFSGEYLNGQMYYIFVFGSAISDIDRLKLMTT